MPYAAEIHFSADHATAAGHFPGNPIVPGAVLLDEVLHVLGADEARAGWTIQAAKFLQPVRPGDLLVVSWESRPDGVIKFEGRLRPSERLALTGSITFHAADR
jgi:3-hydroxyacyl-[acyl-carrier-protein] dehydratase